AGLLLVTSVLGLFLSARWQQQRDAAKSVFDAGRKLAAEGQLTEGYNRMRSATGLLPVSESVYRGYFMRSVAARGASLNREVARRIHSCEILSAVASPHGRSVLFGDIDGAANLWDLADNTIRVLRTHDGREGITAVAFDQSGTLCASGGYDNRVT